MKAIQNFDGIQASNGGSSLLAPGAYTCKVLAVHDHTNEAKPYLSVVFDVYDRDTKRFRFADVAADSNQDWRHEFRFYVGTEFGQQRYKALIEAVEGSKENGGYRYQNVDGAEQTLAGKWVGFVIRHRLYTRQQGQHAGEDATAPDLAGAITCADALAGKFPPNWVEPRDQRDQSQQTAPVAAPPVTPAPVQAPVAVPVAPAPDFADEDIPF